MLLNRCLPWWNKLNTQQLNGIFWSFFRFSLDLLIIFSFLSRKAPGSLKAYLLSLHTLFCCSFYRLDLVIGEIIVFPLGVIPIFLMIARDSYSYEVEFDQAWTAVRDEINNNGLYEEYKVLQTEAFAWCDCRLFAWPWPHGVGWWARREVWI